MHKFDYYPAASYKPEKLLRLGNDKALWLGYIWFQSLYIPITENYQFLDVK